MVNISPEDYPTNYDWLTDTQKENILKWFNTRATRAAKLYPLIGSEVREISKSYKERFDQECYGMRTAQSVLGTLGIRVEYSWRGKGNEWFLATYDDAMIQEDFLFSMYPDG